MEARLWSLGLTVWFECLVMLYVEETRPVGLESSVDSETLDSPGWRDAPDNVRALLNDRQSGISYLDVSATASEDGRELAIFLVNR